MVRPGTLGITLALAALTVMSAVRLAGQSTPPSSTGRPPAAVPSSKRTDLSAGALAKADTTSQRALLDKYCVTCHSDRLKTANLSLQGLDLTTVADHAEVWEKVIRKMRAGVMPPPGVPRPALAEYEGLRDFLESEIDRVATTKSSPGAVV